MQKKPHSYVISYSLFEYKINEKLSADNKSAKVKYEARNWGAIGSKFCSIDHLLAGLISLGLHAVLFLVEPGKAEHAEVDQTAGIRPVAPPLAASLSSPGLPEVGEETSPCPPTENGAPSWQAMDQEHACLDLAVDSPDWMALLNSGMGSEGGKSLGEASFLAAQAGGLAGGQGAWLSRMGEFSGAAAIWTPQLAYPEWARQKKLEGSVWLELWIDPRGVARRGGILQGSGSSRLDEETLRLIQAQWRFQKDLTNGLRRVSVRIDYALR